MLPSNGCSQKSKIILPRKKKKTILCSLHIPELCWWFVRNNAELSCQTSTTLRRAWIESKLWGKKRCQYLSIFLSKEQCQEPASPFMFWWQQHFYEFEVTEHTLVKVSCKALLRVCKLVLPELLRASVLRGSVLPRS